MSRLLLRLVSFTALVCNAKRVEDGAMHKVIESLHASSQGGVASAAEESKATNAQKQGMKKRQTESTWLKLQEAGMNMEEALWKKKKDEKKPIEIGKDGCLDEPDGWTSSTGNSCAQYARKRWCTPNGAYGSGWKSQFENFAKWKVDGIDATQACCACGGGSTKAAELNAFDAENCPDNKENPPTCWANSAYQMCPVNRQGAYDAVMAKAPSMEEMHAEYLRLLEEKVGCTETASTGGPSDAANCPYNKENPATCWADSAYQACGVNPQGAYDAVMGKAPHMQQMHAMYLEVITDKIVCTGEKEFPTGSPYEK